jgi:hypothetical protein
MHDQCLSLRALVDLLTPKAPEPQATTELREPAKAKRQAQPLEYKTKAADPEAKPATKAK